MWAYVPAPSILLGNVGLGSMVLYPQGVESQKVLTEMQTTAWLGIQGGGTYSDPYASVRSLRLECIMSGLRTLMVKQKNALSKKNLI